MDIAVIGSNMVDLITYINDMPKEGETLEAPDFAIGCGGKGANQAVAAAKMGSQVMMVSSVGDDMFAENTLRNFENHRIDSTFVHQIPNVSSGVAPIFVDAESKNRILIIKGANAYVSPEMIDQAAERLKQSSLIILQLEIPLETVYRAIAFGKKHGIPVILNPAPASKELDFETVCQCDFLVPNESELELLTGLPVETDEDVESAARVLLETGVKHVIVTLGSRGVIWMTQDEKHFIPSYKVEALDTTGAGDAFIGAFAHEFVKSGDVLNSLEVATAFAALSVTKRGTQSSYPTAEEVLELMASRVG